MNGRAQSGPISYLDKKLQGASWVAVRRLCVIRCFSLLSYLIINWEATGAQDQVPLAGCREGGFKMHFSNFHNRYNKKAMQFKKPLI